jgi:hypothetical protein
VAVYTNDEVVNDIVFLDADGLTIISDSGIKKISFNIAEKKIYLALRDAAGNASSDVNTISTSIDIDDLTNFTNSNRLLELDEYGAEIFTYDGTAPFYSGNKVIVEKGVYFSEIFNGTNDHVAWDIIYWDAYVPEDTDLNIYVRTGDSRASILLNDFDKVFTKEEFEGADISTLSGQFIQFKVVLSTTERGKSPKLYRVNIRSHARSSVHFFTSNFTLPSPLRKGMITAETFVPVAADIIFGINTNDSVDFSDYQIVDPDRVFSTDKDQNGQNLRIGIKLISPLTFVPATDDLDEYSPYDTFAYNNVIDFEFTAGTTAAYSFKAELYDDPEFNSLATTLYSATQPEAFSADNEEFSADGLALTSGDTAQIIIGARGNASIRCNEFYYLKLYSGIGSTFTLIDDESAFVATCNPTFSDVVTFDYTNTGATANHHFRVQVYSDVTRTDNVATFYSGNDQSGWIVDNSILGGGGANITTGDTVSVEFTPDLATATAQVYFLVVDAFDGDDFINVSRSFYLRVSPDSTYSCGEYFDVPVVKNMVIMFEIEEYEETFGSRKRLRRTVPMNI